MINLRYLETSFPNHPELVAEVIDTLIIEYPSFVNHLKDAIRTNNLFQMSEIAHKWKYTAKILGLDSLVSDLRQLEYCEKLNRLETEQLGQKLFLQMESVFHELKSYEAA